MGELNDTTVYRAFVHRLDTRLRVELDSIRRTYKATRQPFGWQQVVEVCRDLALGASLAPPAVGGGAPAPAPLGQVAKPAPVLVPQVTPAG